MSLCLLWSIKVILFMREILRRVRLLRMRGLLWNICLSVGISRKMLCFLGDLLVGLLRFKLQVISKRVVLSYSAHFSPLKKSPKISTVNAHQPS